PAADYCRPAQVPSTSASSFAARQLVAQSATGSYARGVKLAELRTQALRYLALGEYARALAVYERLIAQLPNDLDTRLRIGDLLAQIGPRELARRVSAAVAYYDLQGGRPLHALVAVQALADLGHEVAPLRRRIGQLYGAGSPKIAKVGARLSPPLGDEDVAP